MNSAPNILDELCLLAEKNNHIEAELYPKYNVKRGLRNKDGSGVLAGLTEIGDVHGYIMDENEKTPVEGKLRYRGIDVDDIVSHAEKEKRFVFEETCYLLLFGQLPTQKTLDEFTALLDSNRELPGGFTENMILKAPSSDIMNSLARSVLACHSYDSNPDDTDIKNVLRQSIELISRVPTMVAYGFQAKSHYFLHKSLIIHKPLRGLSTAEDLLRMIRPDSSFTKDEAEMLDLALMLHAEHGGGNNSTFTARVVSSVATDTYSAMAAAIGSLKGPKHGGANVEVEAMMREIKDNVKDWKDDAEIARYLEKILRKEAFDRSGLIYGLGHAVYTLSDPRALILKKKALKMAEEKGRKDEFLLYENVARLGQTAITKLKGDGKVMAPNVDFYSGFVYSMLNIPADLYTPIFAVARIPGWCAHRMEELISGGRVIRPAYKNVMQKRPYTPMSERTGKGVQTAAPAK